MGPNNTPEQQSKESNQSRMERLAQQAVQEIISRLHEIDNSPDLSPQEKAQQKSEISSSVLNKHLQIQEALENLKQSTRSGEASEQQKKDIQKEQQNLRQSFIKISTLADNDVRVVENDKAQRILRELSKVAPPTDSEAVAIQDALGDYLLGDRAKDIIITKPGETKSDFMQALDNLAGGNQIAADKIKTALVNRAIDFDMNQAEMIENFNQVAPENNSSENRTQNGRPEQSIDEQRFGADYIYYQNRFTDEQLKLIKSFYSPEGFVTYMEKMSNGDDQDKNDKSFKSTERVRNEKREIRESIKKYYEKNPEELKGKDLNQKIEADLTRHWGEKVSGDLNWKVSDVINQLFLELQQKAPNKFYDQIMQEDIFNGPSVILKKIQTAINALSTKVDHIEGDGTELATRMENLKLYRYAVAEHVIEERNDPKDPNNINKKIYPRIKPIPFGEKIDLGLFVAHINMTIDQTIHKTEYFHNARAIYNHPPGEKGFYHQLGEFAEQLKGADIEEILTLPDGQYVLEAYQLYEKMLQEDFAQLDHRHRPDQLTNKLERVNSEIEEEVIKQLTDFYPDLSRQRIKNIVNAGVGIGRGMTLTESEMSAYADPVDSDGKGMVASYSTNDAGSLNVFNPMHTIMRWQGEHNFNSAYFMPVGGEPGAWDHNKAWKNMAKYMDSYIVGKGRGEGKDGLHKEVFADSLTNIGGVGGFGTRKGWRMLQALEGHFVYDKDGTIQASDTFQAMEAMGYEAIFNFVTLKQLGKPLMKEVNKPDQVEERNKLFEYIYSKYFHTGDKSTFQKSDFNNYMAELRKKGEESALKEIKKNGSPSVEGTWEEQVTYETSNLFMENLLAHYTFARMPTKFMRIDKNRLHENGISNWETVWREFRDKKNPPWTRGDFDHVMKDLTMAEMLLRRKIGKIIREKIKLNKDWTLDKIDEITDLPYRLNSKNIRELLSENESDDANRQKKNFKSPEEIEKVVELYEQISKHFRNSKFLDGQGKKEINAFKFTFGMEDTDLSLMGFRGTGPRMTARAIKDTATMEKELIPWIIQMPFVLNEVAINGKHDFAPIIEYMRKAQQALSGIHGVPGSYKFLYKIAGTVINYFKKDGMAKPLFGLFRLGQKNSIAAEYAGRSSAVWEWDSRDIDRFAVALESFQLLKNSPYDLQAPGNDGKYTGGKLEDRWIKLPGLKPFKFGKKRHVDYEFNALKLRKEHGADWRAISWDMLNQFVPLAIAFLLWKYMKDALDEATGEKKK